MQLLDKIKNHYLYKLTDLGVKPMSYFIIKIESTDKAEFRWYSLENVDIFYEVQNHKRSYRVWIFNRDKLKELNEINGFNIKSGGLIIKLVKEAQAFDTANKFLYFKTIGTLFGYPKKCVEFFAQMMINKRTPPRFARSKICDQLSIVSDLDCNDGDVFIKKCDQIILNLKIFDSENNISQ